MVARNPADFGLRGNRSPGIFRIHLPLGFAVTLVASVELTGMAAIAAEVTPALRFLTEPVS